jgi:hypothetical protein
MFAVVFVCFVAACGFVAGTVLIGEYVLGGFAGFMFSFGVVASLLVGLAFAADMKRKRDQ